MILLFYFSSVSCQPCPTFGDDEETSQSISEIIIFKDMTSLVKVGPQSAYKAWNKLQGLLAVYKPPGLVTFHVKDTIETAIIKGLYDREWSKCILLGTLDYF